MKKGRIQSENLERKALKYKDDDHTPLDPILYRTNCQAAYISEMAGNRT
jgi:hypothetical protein